VPYNVPSNVDKDNFSFGPAVVYIGATGSTPTTEVGAVNADDGVTFEITVVREAVAQGNPKLDLMRFDTAQGARISFSGIEWDPTINFQHAVGVGITAADASEETFSFGGDPLPDDFSIQVEHYMAKSGNTMFVDMWVATGEGALSVQMGAELHQFPYAYAALRATTNWAGAALAVGEELFRVRRVL